MFFIVFFMESVIRARRSALMQNEPSLERWQSSPFSILEYSLLTNITTREDSRGSGGILNIECIIQ